MPISLIVRVGQILGCNFEGFEAPEMVRKRPVLVLNSELPGRRSGLATVVALSSKAPQIVMPYHFKLPDDCVPQCWRCRGNESWVKGDMISTVAYRRLDLLVDKYDHRGRMMYLTKPIHSELMKQIHACVLHGMGLGALAEYLLLAHQTSEAA